MKPNLSGKTNAQEFAVLSLRCELSGTALQLRLTIQFSYFDCSYIWSEKMKWANVTKLQNDEIYIKITPVLVFFVAIFVLYLV